MATLVSQLQPIQVIPGVQPIEDRTRLNTPHYTYADKVRFWRGSPQKIGGWLSVLFELGETIMGIARTLYSAIIQELQATVIGTNTDLYSLYGNSLINISPVETTTHAIANSIETNYATLANNPVTTAIGTGNLAIADTSAALYQAGDTYTLSGATTTNGITNTLINAAHIIRSIGTNVVNVTVSGTASSSGSGGGASVVRATGLLRFTAATNGIRDGERVKILAAGNTGGILAAAINLEFIARNVATNTFDVMTAGTATSHVTAGGGASTTYQKQIEDGNADESVGVGYGGGLYGAGLYGVSKTFSSVSLPRIWFMDRFGDVIIGTPGNQAGVYQWDGDPDVAPTLISGAPTTVNYIFVSDNILITLGYNGFPNQIFSSDQGDPTQWTASSTNQVFQDIIEGAGRFLSHVPVLGINLIFTPNQTYRFSYIGLQAGVWEIKLLDNSIGIIAAMARCSVNNVAYWMSENNFYRWSGGNVEIIPANTQDQCTALEYVFGDINSAQMAKCFAWFNPRFNEVWFHYPSADSNECDRYITVSITNNVWSIGTLDRTCAEYPSNLFNFPRLISSEGVFYNHEQGYNDDADPMAFTLTSNFLPPVKESFLLSGIIPDSTQTGDITFNAKGYLWPNSSDTAFDKDFTVPATGTGNSPLVNTQIGGRFRLYTWSGEVLDQNWNMGQWYEQIQKGPPH